MRALIFLLLFLTKLTAFQIPDYVPLSKTLPPPLPKSVEVLQNRLQMRSLNKVFYWQRLLKSVGFFAILFLFSLLFAALCLLLYPLFRPYLPKRDHISTEKKIALLRKQLEELYEGQTEGETKMRIARIKAITKEYLSLSLNFDAISMTTEEIERSLSKKSANKVVQFLHHCDIALFAETSGASFSEKKAQALRILTSQKISL